MGINIICRSLLFRNGIFLKHPCNSISFESYKGGVCCCCNLSIVPTENLTSKLQFSTVHGGTVPYTHCAKRTRFDKITNAYRRFFSSETSPPSNKLPPLMNFPQIIWPSIIKSIRNFILTTFIVKPYLDREFNFPDFVVGSKKAVEVSKCIVNTLWEINYNITGSIVKDRRGRYKIIRWSCNKRRCPVCSKSCFFNEFITKRTNSC